MHIICWSTAHLIISLLNSWNSGNFTLENYFKLFLFILFFEISKFYLGKYINDMYHHWWSSIKSMNYTAYRWCMLIFETLPEKIERNGQTGIGQRHALDVWQGNFFSIFLSNN
jgi:hypothetical protein